VRTLMMHLEDLVRREPNATFAEVIDQFEKAREHDVGSVKTSLTQAEGKVTVITAHKAKGMEFERVFVTALTKGEWEGRGKSALLPSPFDAPREAAEVARLLYVALTRAKDALVLSYSRATAEGKEQVPMSLLPTGLTPCTVTPDPLPLLHAQYEATALVRELTIRYLAHDGLSPSALNEYLESPPTFFARRVLRLREPETRALSVGNAVHAAVAAWLTAAEDSARLDAARAALSRSLARSLLPRGDTFDALARHAEGLLAAAVASPVLAGETLAIEESFSVPREAAGVRVLLKGTVDAVFREPRGECIVDFKTSTKIEKKDREKFERQIAFYDLLLRANGHLPTSGKIVQVTEDALQEHAVALTEETRAELARTLDAVLAELVSGRWRAGAPSEYDALLALVR
jgi:ATP-dependent exoDNAse (exonuclease V) beta subunit